MTRGFSQGVSEKLTANMGVAKTSHIVRQAIRPPKFVDHPELKGRWAYERLFVKPAEEPLRNPAMERELRRFKRMHFCGRRMKGLLDRHGAGVLQRVDYKHFADLRKQLQDSIASDNVGLVYHLCKHRQIPNVDDDELLSEGMMALARSIDTFNPWLGYRFSTYACNSIVRAFYRYRLQSSKRRQHESAIFESGSEKGDWLDTCRTEQSGLYTERLASILAGGTAELTRTEQHVLDQRFPFDPGTRRRTLTDIAPLLKLSKERVRQIEKVALGKLRAALECDPVLGSAPLEPE
jgi:RNA polymerase sigma factor (sigma-70 family)